MSAERRRREDSHPSNERTSGAQGRPGSGRAGEAWSSEFQHDPGPLGGGHGDWPGDSQLDQAWASSYRFDGSPSDEPWRDPGQRGDSSPADQARHHDAPSGGGDDWIARTQVDQSWRYRSLADDNQAEDRAGDDWPGLDPAAEAGRTSGEAPGRRASDNWPASTQPGEAWRESSHTGTGRAADSYAVGPRAVDPFAAAGPAVDPHATGPFTGDYASPFAGDYASAGRPSGTHVVGGRRASDSWLADTQMDESVPAVGGRVRDGLTAGDQATSGRDDSGRDDSGRDYSGRDYSDWGDSDRDDSDWGEGGRPGGRRRILVSVMAAVAVALALGTYGLIRVHDESTVTLQDASRPCAAHAARCHSHSPRTPGPGRNSPMVSNSRVPGSPGSPTRGASGTPSTTPSHLAAPTSMPASVPPPTHSAAPPPPAAPSASASQATGTASSAAAAQVLTVINQARAQQGLPALAISSGLNTSSAAHTSVMASGCGLSHQCPGEPALGTRLTNAGVQWTSAGENIGEGGPEPDNTAAITQMAVNLTQSMLNEQPPDDGHRMNILSSSFHSIGITVFLDSKGTVWMTQDFSN
jgi:uncharacterized protein YkwD